ncbi:MAG: S-methyl-5-thioribose-1-phosphate isomerase [Candidatus Dadabacteria bacterium]|nr:S-methyl-5-thioribose-1-phosphate isomerase [Candidatus Dadabacteria bacterium]NIQ14357.1 S-methyl-5-thioribose-1-phosphate isomerase [Candidatus Dadabacteria bacterium]
MSSWKTIEWEKNKVIMIDQRVLPNKEVYIKCKNHKEVAKCIKEMVIRGAPAIGVAAAMGVALGSINIKTHSKKVFDKKFNKICKDLSETRPTAVNLFWAINKMKHLYNRNKDHSLSEIKELLIKEAKNILKEDIETCMKIGKNGSKLLKNDSVVLTHCNAGGLATGGYGTALGVIRAACEDGKNIKVISSETRPFLQGSRLTAWELKKDNIPVQLITDNMAGHLMKNGMIDSIVVGADRIASNGDVANKIGTYSLSVLAKHHNLPFYVAAPLSTIDLDCNNGTEIPIEQRNTKEVTHIGKKRIAADVEILNPAFDITPNENINCLITEAGLHEKPYEKSLKNIKNIKIK